MRYLKSSKNIEKNEHFANLTNLASNTQSIVTDTVFMLQQGTRNIATMSSVASPVVLTFLLWHKI